MADRLHEQYLWLRLLTIAVLLVIYRGAGARPAVPFQRFVYFRF